MKIRNGFVSNSSSTSFCIYGTFIDQNDDFDEATEAKFKVHKISYRCGECGEGRYVGRNWRDISDDETGKAFKTSIENAIKDIFGDKFKCSTYEESWYNG